MSNQEVDQSRTAPTLSAVAKLAGVSSITVSRVVRLPNLVKPRTRERVEAAMRELGYVPNQVAGSLASARTTSGGARCGGRGQAPAQVRSVVWCRPSPTRFLQIRGRAGPTNASRLVMR